MSMYRRTMRQKSKKKRPLSVNSLDERSRTSLMGQMVDMTSLGISPEHPMKRSVSDLFAGMAYGMYQSRSESNTTAAAGGCERNGSIRHEESNDSGFLSGAGSAENCRDDVHKSADPGGAGRGLHTLKPGESKHMFLTYRLHETRLSGSCRVGETCTRKSDGLQPKAVQPRSRSIESFSGQQNGSALFSPSHGKHNISLSQTSSPQRSSSAASTPKTSPTDTRLPNQRSDYRPRPSSSDMVKLNYSMAAAVVENKTLRQQEGKIVTVAVESKSILKQTPIPRAEPAVSVPKPEAASSTKQVLRSTMKSVHYYDYDSFLGSSQVSSITLEEILLSNLDVVRDKVLSNNEVIFAQVGLSWPR